MWGKGTEKEKLVKNKLKEEIERVNVHLWYRMRHHIRDQDKKNIKELLGQKKSNMTKQQIKGGNWKDFFFLRKFQGKQKMTDKLKQS